MEVETIRSLKYIYVSQFLSDNFENHLQRVGVLTSPAPGNQTLSLGNILILHCEGGRKAGES